MSTYLFVYGTLHPDQAPPEIGATVRKLTLLGPAMIRGTRYDLGEYPGLLVGPGHDDIVCGTVFALPEDAMTLAELDAYEGFRPDDPAASLFLRALHQVTLADGGELLCWVYLYNRDPPK